jgi:hypothetical protein
VSPPPQRTAALGKTIRQWFAQQQIDAVTNGKSGKNSTGWVAAISGGRGINKSARSLPERRRLPARLISLLTLGP